MYKPKKYHAMINQCEDVSALTTPKSSGQCAQSYCILVWICEWNACEDVCRKVVPLVQNQTGFVRWFGINIYVTAFSVTV